MSDLEPSRRNGSDQLNGGDLPGLARVVAVSSFRIGAWAATTGFKAGRRALDVARHPEQALEFAEDVRIAAAVITRAVVGDEVEQRLRTVANDNAVVRVVTERFEAAAQPAEEPGKQVNPLHAAGQELLRRSRDVWADDVGHPAYVRIIEELAPDEARILLLLLRSGPQPTVDVRTGGLIGTVSSDMVAPNLNMIGARAGCRYVDRVPSYLHNLERLGLVWFSSDALKDPMEYQVLEAQPEVVDAMHRVRRAKCVRRSIQLTPFGDDFCRDGLGLHLAEGPSVAPPHVKPDPHPKPAQH